MPPLSGSHIGRVWPLTPAPRNPSAAIAPTTVTTRVLLRFTTLLLVEARVGRVTAIMAEFIAALILTRN
jgi:hypothetical protein